MKKININQAQKNFFKIVDEVNNKHRHIKIIGANDNNAILISEEEWNSIEETLLLQNHPMVVSSILNIKNNENWDKALTYDSNEDW